VRIAGQFPKTSLRGKRSKTGSEVERGERGEEGVPLTNSLELIIPKTEHSPTGLKEAGLGGRPPSPIGESRGHRLGGATSGKQRGINLRQGSHRRRDKNRESESCEQYDGANRKRIKIFSQKKTIEGGELGLAGGSLFRGKYSGEGKIEEGEGRTARARLEADGGAEETRSVRKVGESGQKGKVDRTFGRKPPNADDKNPPPGTELFESPADKNSERQKIARP